MAADADLSKHNNQADYPAEFNEEDSVLPEGRGIADMAAAAAKKGENDSSQKDDGVATSGGMSAMKVPTVPEKQNNIFESFIKLTNGGGVPPDGYIPAMAEDEEVKKQVCSDKYEGGAPTCIAAMAAAASLLKHLVRLNHH